MCCWPLLHKYLQERAHHGSIRGVVMGVLDPDQLRPGLRAGARENHERDERGEQGTINAVLNPEEQLRAVAALGPVRVAQRNMTKFMAAAENIDPEMLEQCDMPEWREQYRVFYDKLASVTLLPGSEEFSSMELLVKLINTKGELYKGCEAVIGILVQAATMKSVESVVESWISVLEHHSSKSRNLSADMIQTEMSIAINGPAVQHSEGIVRESMRRYWGGTKNLKDGHFTRKSQNIKSYMVSEAVDSLNNILKKNQLME